MNSFSVGQDNLTWVMELLNSINMSPHNIINSFTDYSAYFFWVSVLFLLLFSPVLIILGFIYFSNFLLHIYKRKVNLKEDYLCQSWDNGRRAVAHLWDMYGTVWHDFKGLHCFMSETRSFGIGYEIHGMDKIPEGPGLIVFYHGAFPLDYYYFVSRLYLRTGRFCCTVVDYHFSKIPGIKLFYNVEGLTHNGRTECTDILKRGYLLGVLPGGTREALFSDENYDFLWGSRTGFAHVARDAKVIDAKLDNSSENLELLHYESPEMKVERAYSFPLNIVVVELIPQFQPVIPIFTKNLREGYRTLGKIWPFKWLYERTRWPIVPIYGGFPVKFCTYIGDPIPYDPNISAGELAEKTKSAIKDLRDKYQEIPGSIQRALLERFEKHPEK